MLLIEGGSVGVGVACMAGDGTAVGIGEGVGAIVARQLCRLWFQRVTDELVAIAEPVLSGIRCHEILLPMLLV